RRWQALLAIAIHAALLLLRQIIGRPVGIADQRPRRIPASLALVVGGVIGPAIVLAPGIDFVTRHQLVLGVDRVAAAVPAEIFDHGSVAPTGLAGNRARNQELLGVRRRRAERRPGGVFRPHRLHDRLEDRDRNAGAGLAR